jgi:hypothetical protein
VAPLVGTKEWLRTRAPFSSGLMVVSCLRDDHVRAMVPKKTQSEMLRPRVGAVKQKSDRHETFERQPDRLQQNCAAGKASAGRVPSGDENIC